MDNLPPSAAASSERKQNPPASQQLKSKIETAKEEAAKFKQGASEQTAASFESAKTNIKEVAQEAAGYGENVLNEQKNRLADIVHEYCQAAKAASEKLHQESHAPLADRADEMASHLDRASTYLREKKLSEIYHDAEHFTRRRPEIAFGTMFAVGLALARFLKASDRGVARGWASNVENERNLSEASATISSVAPPTIAQGPERTF